MSFLRTVNLAKTYSNGVKAVKNLNLQVEKGDVYGFIGPNGAGKTTTIRMLMGILSPTGGQVTFEGSKGIDLSRVGYLPEDANFYSFLNVREYLQWTCKLYNREGCCDRVAESLAVVELNNLNQRKLNELSKGQLQRVGIAQSLVHEPDLLIFDEPTSGLDPVGKRKILSTITQLSKRGKTVLTSSHILPELSKICTSVGIIREGELVLQGSMNQLKKRYATSKVEIGFDSMDPKLQKELSNLEFVTEIVEEDNEGLRLLLHITDEGRAKTELPKLITNSESVLTHYDFAQVTLEDIFMETIEGGENEG